jgi:hypothetical protein
VPTIFINTTIFIHNWLLKAQAKSSPADSWQDIPSSSTGRDAQPWGQTRSCLNPMRQELRCLPYSYL